jgi:hypothetical protein
MAPIRRACMAEDSVTRNGPHILSSQGGMADFRRKSAVSPLLWVWSDVVGMTCRLSVPVIWFQVETCITDTRLRILHGMIV